MMDTVSPSQLSNVQRFFALTLCISWGLGLPAVLAKHGVLDGGVEAYVVLVGLGAFGPMIAAMVLARRESGGIRALFRLRGATPASPWLVFGAPFVSGGILVSGLLAYQVVGGEVDRWLYLPTEPERIVAMFVFSFGEEVGWRGYALPRLLPVAGPLAASAVIGLVWAVWHLMMLLVEGTPATAMVLMLPFFIAGSVVFTAAYAKSGGSLGVAILMHMGAHLNNANRALPDSVLPFAVQTAAFVAVAAVLVARDREWWLAPAPRVSRRAARHLGRR